MKLRKRFCNNKEIVIYYVSVSVRSDRFDPRRTFSSYPLLNSTRCKYLRRHLSSKLSNTWNFTSSLNSSKEPSLLFDNTRQIYSSYRNRKETDRDIRLEGRSSLYTREYRIVKEDEGSTRTERHDGQSV